MREEGGRGRVAGRKTLVPLVLLLSVDVDAARWRERQLGVDGFAAWRVFAKRGASVEQERGPRSEGEIRIERAGEILVDEWSRSCDEKIISGDN